MVFVFIVLWYICACFTEAVMLHFFRDEWIYAPWLLMLVCITTWPLVALMGLAYVALNQLSKVPMFIAGFLDGIAKKGGEDDDTVL